MESKDGTGRGRARLAIRLPRERTAEFAEGGHELRFERLERREPAQRLKIVEELGEAMRMDMRPKLLCTPPYEPAGKPELLVQDRLGVGLLLHRPH